jgi:hypothetical protein
MSALKSFSKYVPKNTPSRFDFTSPEFQMWIFATTVIPAILFVVLSPGLLLNLPANTKESCATKIPYPKVAGATTGAVSVVADGSNGCDDAVPNAGIADICDAREKCHKIFISTYTSVPSIVLHAVVFAVLLAAVAIAIRRFSKY